MRRNTRYAVSIIFTIILSLLFTNNLIAENRLALLIGNSNYIHGGSLKNSVTDVRAMKRALESLGFTVLKYENCTQKTMKRAMDNFGIELQGQDVGLFFYSGHGVQVNGHNYLIPTNARLHNENDTEYDCVRADRVLAKMESAVTKTSIVILDACRDNPFERSWRKGTKGTGLAFMNAPSGSLIAYSTAPGKTALDGRGNHSPYTSALLQHIGTANITVLEMFQGVRSTVMAKTGGKQTPWESTSLRGNFYFASKGTERNRLEQERRELERIRAEIERKRREIDRQKVETASLPQKPSNYRPPTTSKVIKRDGVYVAYANGIVKDTKTGLEWKVGPDRETNWNEARSWVQSLSLDGGGWRMPTTDELAGLYERGKGDRNMTPLLKTTGGWVWAGETKGSSSAWFFRFDAGGRDWGTRGNSVHVRAFAVRSRSDGLKVTPDQKIRGKLFVQTDPKGSRVRILNIKPKFYQGMDLVSGSYHVEVSKTNYKTKKMWVKLEPGESKQLEIRLEQLQASIQPIPTYTPPSPATNVLKMDGIYVAYANGIVKDTKTGLEWKAGPDKNTTWNEARSWVQSLNLDGGGWRMPTSDELRTLYKQGAGSRNMTPLLKTTGWWVWSGETKGSSSAWNFFFRDGGYRSWYRRERSDSLRAFAVLSRGDEVFSPTQKPSYSRPSPSSNAIKLHSYVAYANGIVKNTSTGLEWKAGPDKNTNWDAARDWVLSLNLDGGGWRMPTVYELKGLYKKGAGSRNMTPLLKTSGWYVWSGKTTGSSLARHFDFIDGRSFGYFRDYSGNSRAFAVRFRNDASRADQLQTSAHKISPDTRPASISNVINRDGVYVDYANGIVRDIKTGLEWKAGPDRDTNWNEARNWVQSLNLDGGGWRMPTMDELAGLYEDGSGKRNMTPLFKTTGWYVWSGETKGSSYTWLLFFNLGRRDWLSNDFSRNSRAFAVRSPSDR
ncbi:MAG: DUF1566 domain-containing protein [Deltaproteobacteria bacterium]|nr:DUF1566 domain-containing protein [Deltaproteobacteria bacterium]